MTIGGPPSEPVVVAAAAIANAPVVPIMVTGETLREV
jgi:hypothetical protein